MDVQCRHLYGLIHARWIVTARGLTKMVRYRSSLSSLPTFPISYCYSFPSPRNSSRNTNERTLVDVRASSASLNLSSPSVSPTSPTKNPSSSIVVDAKTFTLPNPLGTARSMVLTLELLSLTSFSLFTPLLSRPSSALSMSLPLWEGTETRTMVRDEREG